MPSLSEPLSIEQHRFDDDGHIPNSHLPLLVYRQLLRVGGIDPAGAAAAALAGHGWVKSWRNGVYAFHHFHSTAHEILAVVAGTARVLFGGARGTAVDLRAGDAVAIPAGVGHKRETASSDFCVVGAYADGRDWDLLRGEPDQRTTALANIERVPVPTSDPVLGSDGPLPRLWRKANGG